MATATDLIEASLRELGVLESGEAAEGNDLTDAFNALNRLLSLWQAQRQRIYTVTRSTWTIASGTGQYNVGPGQTVNVARPIYVNHVNFQDTSLTPNHEWPMDILTEDAWSRIRQKTQTAARPVYAYYNPVYPTATIDLWPVPTSSTLQGVLYAWTAVSEFSAVTDTVSLPPGYEQMIVKNLALELAPGYERQPNPLLIEQAREATRTVKQANKRLADLEMDAAALIQGRDRGWAYDIYTN